MERRHEPVGAHDDRPLWQLILPLLDVAQVVARRVGLADCARGQVHDLVAVVDNVGVELCDAEVSPVAADRVEQVAERVRPGARETKGTASAEEGKGGISEAANFVMVPSMSEMTMWSSALQRKMRAEQVAMPE